MTTFLIFLGIALALTFLYYFAVGAILGLVTTLFAYLLFGNIYIAGILGILSAFGAMIMLFEDATKGTCWFK